MQGAEEVVVELLAAAVEPVAGGTEQAVVAVVKVPIFSQTSHDQKA